MTAKYKPLENYLQDQPIDIDELTLSFTDIESIIKADLPKSARYYRQWWENQSDTSNRPQAAAWINAGWEVDTVDQANGWVRFRRK